MGRGHANGDFDLDGVDWHRIVDGMNVSFGMFRFEPATEDSPSDIFLLYANKAYTAHLREFTNDIGGLSGEGYVHGGAHLDAQMLHNIKKALYERVQVHDKLYVTSMGVWIDYYITPMQQENCYYIVIIDINEEQRHLEEVERMGMVDALTDVGNRNALQAAEEELRGKDESLGVVVADLNGLKQVNDSQGHEAGDEAIAGVGRLLKESFPEWDVYRFGGDEFVALAVGAEEVKFARAASDFADSCASGDDARLSVGYAWGASSREIDAIMHDADDAMYAMKRAYYKTHDRRQR